MSIFKFIITILLISGTARAELAHCTDWPTIVAGSGPSGAVTGLPLTYNFRLSCLLGPSYSLGEFRAHYVAAAGELFPFESLAVSNLPGGDVLFQALFSVPQQQRAGLYVISACQVVSRAQDLVTRCLVLPESTMELRSSEQ